MYVSTVMYVQYKVYEYKEAMVSIHFILLLESALSVVAIV